MTKEERGSAANHWNETVYFYIAVYASTGRATKQCLNSLLQKRKNGQ